MTDATAGVHRGTCGRGGVAASGAGAAAEDASNWILHPGSPGPSNFSRGRFPARAEQKHHRLVKLEVEDSWSRVASWRECPRIKLPSQIIRSPSSTASTTETRFQLPRDIEVNPGIPIRGQQKHPTPNGNYRARASAPGSVQSHGIGSRQPAFPALKCAPFHIGRRMRLNRFNARRLAALWTYDRGRRCRGW
jgi:hypothetical protein